MPKEGYILESFARLAVSEALHYKNINWARLAAENWRTREAPTEIIVYKEGGQEVTYNYVISSTLKSGIEQLQDELKNLEEEYKKAKNSQQILEKEPCGTKKIRNI